MNTRSLLLIDDAADDIALTRDAIEEAEDRSRTEIALSVCRNGEEAQTFLRSLPLPLLPEVILLDLNMPRMDGHTFLAWIKSQPELATIPVVILTTSIQADDVNRAYQNHCAAYLEKPVSYEQFVQLMRRFSVFWFKDIVLPRRVHEPDIDSYC